MKCKICSDPIPKNTRKDRPRQVCSISCRQVLNARKGKGVKGNRGKHLFKGGRILNDDGYWRVAVGDHPYPRKNYYMFEHVKVVEESIGRRIKPTECVHHINHDRQDNRLENLQLMKKSEHQKLHKGSA